MNEHRGSRGPSWALLLLIPAAVIIAKGAKRRRAMWESGWAASGPVGEGYGHHRRLGGDVEPGQQAAFRLPPKIERMLDTWHTRTHEAAASTEPQTSPDAPTA